MEALWNLEDKWKITTQGAVILFSCTAFLVGGICIATALKRRARQRQLVGQEPSEADQSEGSERSGLRPGCGSMKMALVGSVRWSDARKWEEGRSSKRWKERAAPLLVGREREREVGWQSHNSVSPVWQRPILMGEKCELPRFSGLILKFSSQTNVLSVSSGNYAVNRENYTKRSAIVHFSFHFWPLYVPKEEVGEFGPYFVCSRRFWAVLPYVRLAVRTFFCRSVTCFQEYRDLNKHFQLYSSTHRLE